MRRTRARKAEVATDLRRSATLIETNGWSRTPYYQRPMDVGGPMCIATALCVNRFGVYPLPSGKAQRLRDPRYRATYDVLLGYVQHNHGGLAICQFNSRALSDVQVIATLRHVADLLDPSPISTPAPGPRVPVYASAVERRRAYRAELLRMGVDTSDLPPLDDLVVVPDVLPAEWMEATR